MSLQSHSAMHQLIETSNVYLHGSKTGLKAAECILRPVLQTGGEQTIDGGVR